MAKGFSGLPGGGKLQDLVKQAQTLKKQLEQAQQAAAGLKAEGSAGGGVIRVLVNGQNRIEALKIKPEALNPKDASFLEEMLIHALNEALAAVQTKVEAEMSKVTGGASFPGLG